MLRLLLLCVFTAAGLSLSAQDAVAKRSCSAPCQKVASTSCQAKTTSVASTTTPAPDRATASKEEAAPATIQTAFYKLTSLEAPKTNCDPANCQPAACKKMAESATCQPAKTSMALKQE